MVTGRAIVYFGSNKDRFQLQFPDAVCQRLGTMPKERALSSHVGSRDDLAQCLLATQTHVVGDEVAATEGGDDAGVTRVLQLQHRVAVRRTRDELWTHTVATSVACAGCYGQRVQGVERTHTLHEL